MSTADIYLNVMTEADAGTRECCWPRHEAYCVGSKCMAWRWHPLMADEAFKDAVQKRMKQMGDSHVKAAAYVAEHRAEYGLPTKAYLGHCGLAGGWKQ